MAFFWHKNHGWNINAPGGNYANWSIFLREIKKKKVYLETVSP